MYLQGIGRVFYSHKYTSLMLHIHCMYIYLLLFTLVVMHGFTPDSFSSGTMIPKMLFAVLTIWCQTISTTQCTHSLLEIEDYYNYNTSDVFVLISLSYLKNIKSNLRSRLTNESLNACMKLNITKYQPDYKAISKSMQHQKSH